MTHLADFRRTFWTINKSMDLAKKQILALKEQQIIQNSKFDNEWILRALDNYRE